LATAVVCYVLNENATVTTTNLQASVRTQVHAVSMSSDGNVTVLWSQQMAGKNQVKRKRTAKTLNKQYRLHTAVKFN